MKVLIVSDTHRHNENLEKVLKEVKPIDLLIHCGDAEGTEGHIQQICDCPLYIVSGNNDFFSRLPYEAEFSIDKYKVFMCHGHTYYVSMGLERLLDEARVRKADIVLYGHTHRPIIELRDGIMVINPGSISYPRQEGKIPTYVIMEIDKDGDASYTLHYVN
ncbi:MAG: metallophosphoesterase [Lachnospiraceae bacterium]|nr:metallophosphoesterase [Lachnospiraceae bacterium]